MFDADTEWTRGEPLVAPAADAGGDDQDSDAYDTRWLRRMLDGNYALVTRAYYFVRRDGSRFIEEQTEYMICSDPTDPGSTELWADYRYTDVRSVGAPDDPHAAAEAADAPSDDEWFEVAHITV